MPFARAFASFCTAVCVLTALHATAAAAAGGSQVWLVASDIHLDPFNRDAQPSLFGSDTNLTLFRSAIAEMKREVPNPAVVLLPGDFFVHDFPRIARSHGAASPQDAGIATMRLIAEAFQRAFPRAQFAIALGNNDATCGDYRSQIGGAYLAAVARVWKPLVDRGGAAPGFAQSFERGGYYTASLPVRGLRLVVLDTILLSSEYAGNCGGDARDAAADQLAWLSRTLGATPAGMRNVVMMHVPPGYDAFSTEVAREFLPWTFLNARGNSALIGALTRPQNRVAYAIAGHTHRFDFRLAGSLPILVFGAVSPVYRNNPAFYALRVGADGSTRDIAIYAFDEWSQEWIAARSFDRTWGVGHIDAATLQRLHARLGIDPAMRRKWDIESSGWPSNPRIMWATWGRFWRVPWCAQTFLTSGFAECAHIGRRVAAAKIVAVLAALIVVVVCVTAVLLGFRRGRRGRAQPR